MNITTFVFNMKNIFIFLILLLVSCSGLKQTSVSTNKEAPDEEKIKYLEARVKEFKIVFFDECLSRSLNDKRVDYHLGNDRSYSHDYGLGLENYRKIDTLSNMVVKEILRDSTEWTHQICSPSCSGDVLQRMKDSGMVGKKTLEFCLDYYTSEELDSIARAYYFREN